MYTLPPGGIQGENRSEKRFGANQIIQSSWSSANQGAFSELRRRALRGQVKFSSGGPPLLSRCRRRQVSFARRTTRGARPAVRTALAPCLSPKALATSLWPMSALWTPVAPQGLALPPPCYRGVWLPGTSAQCRKSAVPLSLRLVSLAPRLPCLCSRGPFRTLWLPWLDERGVRVASGGWAGRSRGAIHTRRHAAAMRG